jgi:malonate transporter
MTAVIAPIFGTVLLGYLLTRIGIFTREVGEGLTRFMFYLAIPAMLFQSMSSTNLPTDIPWKFICAFYIPSLIVFLTAMIVSGLFFHWRKDEQGIAGVCSAYSNMVLLGLPLLLAAFGERATLPLFILLAPQSLLLFPTTILAVEAYGEHTPKNKALGKDGSLSNTSRKFATVKKLFVNPIIISLGLGVSANIGGWHIPDALTDALRMTGKAAPACALTALGVSLAQYKFQRVEIDSLVLALLKNILHPVLVFLACGLFEVELFWTQVAVFLAAMPCGINAFIFASNYEIKTKNVTQSIVLSTVISIATASFLLAKFTGN